MKKGIITLLILFCAITIHGQESRESKSKMSEFVSQTGSIIKFEDYNLPKIKSLYGNLDVKIRKIMNGNLIKFFYQLSKKGKYDTKTASIAYEDLIEIIKALKELRKRSTGDINTSSDYLENKFITEDDFRIGYYISKNKVVWYVRLDRYGSDNTVFIKDVELFATSFKEGKEKIEKLKEM